MLPPIALNLLNTLITLPSTTPTTSLKAIEATAEAVYLQLMKNENKQ